MTARGFFIDKSLENNIAGLFLLFIKKLGGRYETKTNFSGDRKPARAIVSVNREVDG